MSGIETVMQMPEDRPYVVFLTAHPEHAVKAFDVGAVDYVMKPVDDARLAKAHRARAAVARHGAAKRDGGDAARAKPRKLAIATHDGAALVSPTRGHPRDLRRDRSSPCTRRRARSSPTTPCRISRRSSAGPFERVHRRAIVNLDHVERLESVDSVRH